MALLDIPLDRITEADLQRLITASVSESLYVDYKQTSYGNAESDHVEFLADVSSFANTAGGDVVIGMAETKGVPTAIVSLKGDPDVERRRLEDIARTGLQPRIRNLRTHAIPIEAGGHVIIVRVPRSYMPPHRVNYRNRNRFWARASLGKYEPNVEELRHLFNDAPHLAERIRSFRMDRLVRVNSGETPYPLSEGTKVVLHVIPLPAFADNRLVDIVASIASGTHVPLPLTGVGGNRSAVNIDGYLNYFEGPLGSRSSYAQFFRSGAIEGVLELRRRDTDGAGYFVGDVLANEIIPALRQYVNVLASFDAGFPVFACLSLCNARECYFRYSPSGMGWNDVGPLGRDVVALPEVLIDSSSVDIPSVIRPVLNTLWNAFGFATCDMYDGQGQWRGH
jgi:hypothetical protein